jgi:predicted transcriptional regulator
LITGQETLLWRALAGLFWQTPLARHVLGFAPWFLALGASQPWPRRGHLEIIEEILENVSHGGATKTALVYKTNLNFRIANRYLEYLEKRGMIHRSNGNGLTKYELTEKGRDAHSLLRRTMNEVLEQENLPA